MNFEFQYLQSCVEMRLIWCEQRQHHIIGTLAISTSIVNIFFETKKRDICSTYNHIAPRSLLSSLAYQSEVSINEYELPNWFEFPCDLNDDRHSFAIRRKRQLGQPPIPCVNLLHQFNFFFNR